MAVESKVGTFTIASTDTVSTTQVITIGFEAKVIFFWTMGNPSATDNVVNANTRYGFGVASSTADRRAVGGRSTDGATAINGGRIMRNDACLALCLNTSGVDGLLDISAIGATSFTTIVDDQFTADIQVSYMAVGGSDITNVSVGDVTAPTSSGSVATTGIGFQPDFLLSFGTASTTAPNNTSSSRDFLSVGAAVSATDQAIISVGEGPEGNATSQAKTYIRYGEMSAPLFDTPTSIANRASLTSFDSDGWTMDWVEAAHAYRLFYVAVKGGLWSIGNLTTQTDTVTDIVVTGLGQAPVGVMLLSGASSQSASDTPHSHGVFSLGAFTGASEQVAQAIFMEDGLADTRVSSAIEYDSAYINIASAATSTIQGLAGVTSMDSDGFTLRMTDADPAGNYAWFIAVGQAGGPTTITVYDTGSGSDAVTTVTVGLTLTDAGAGSDTFGSAALIPVADTGAGSDAVAQLLASVGLSDTGSGFDSLVPLSIVVTLTDSGTGSDTISNLAAALTILDSGSGVEGITISSATTITVSDTATITEALSILNSLGVVDSGSGTELATILAQLASSDSATGTDALLISGSIPVSDVGSGSDALGPVQVSLTLSDIGSGSETLTLSVAVQVSDSASASEALNLLTATLKTLSDAGFGSDAVSVPSVSLAVADSGTSVSNVSIATTVQATDSGSGSDTVQLISALISLLDVGSGGETFGVTANVPITDAAVGSESISQLSAVVTVTDSGVAVELLSGAISLSVSDSATSVEALSVILSGTLVSLFDSGVGSENISLVVNLPLVDTVTAQEAIGVSAAATVSDVGSGNDTLLISVLVALSDALSAVDAMGTVTVNVPVSDLASAAETLSQIQVALAILDVGSAIETVASYASDVNIVSISFLWKFRTMTSTWTSRAAEYSMSSRTLVCSIL